jgi:hypothetical protein
VAKDFVFKKNTDFSNFMRERLRKEREKNG